MPMQPVVAPGSRAPPPPPTTGRPAPAIPNRPGPDMSQRMPPSLPGRPQSAGLPPPLIPSWVFDIVGYLYEEHIRSHGRYQSIQKITTWRSQSLNFPFWSLNSLRSCTMYAYLSSVPVYISSQHFTFTHFFISDWFFFSQLLWALHQVGTWFCG